MKKDNYDVIIIGAGIGGLVCGCYLARSGLKVLIIEKNDRVGGCCVSFKRKNFIFDAGVHSLGDFSSGGRLAQLFSDLNLNKKIDIVKCKISDVIINKQYKVEISRNLNYTVVQFQKQFPESSARIEAFFVEITNPNIFHLYKKYYKKNFSFLLNKYFTNQSLKELISIPVSNLGISPFDAAAISGIIVYQKFILDGGYYPLGGMQKFSDVLANRFKEFGGKILTSQKVDKIIVNNNNAEGVFCNSLPIKAKCIVSNCDSRHTFLELIGQEKLEKTFMKKLLRLKQSLSAFIVFLGLNKKLTDSVFSATAIWHFKLGSLKDTFSSLSHPGKIKEFVGNFLCTFPSVHDPTLAPYKNESGYLLMTVPFMNEKYWLKNKDLFTEKMIDNFRQFANISSKEILLKLTATPLTLFKYTGNYKGALHGWEPSSSQIDSSCSPTKTPIKNLYLVGHWVTQPGQGGIAMVVSSGMRTSRVILNNF